jgi:hypothetical protein
MIGGLWKNNDVYFFFENDEFVRLGREKIKGTFMDLNKQDRKASLDIVIDDELCNREMERIVTNAVKNEKEEITHMSVALRKEVYDIVKEKGSFEYHQGYRHVCLADANCLDYYSQMVYAAFSGLIEAGK